jgi:hypothetical protein
MASERGIPVIVDYDDNLFNVQDENPTFEIYSNKNSHENIRKIVRLSTVCTVTNAHLKHVLMREAKIDGTKIEIIPNAHNDYHFKRQFRLPKDKSNLIFWRGSKTHDKDLAEYAKEIVQVSRENPEVTFAFLGSNPWFVKNGMNSSQYIFYRGVDPYDYFKAVATLAPVGFQVPLHENEFNKSKSNIALLEAAYFGSTCLVPKWDGWDLPGAITYTNRKEYAEGLRAIIQNKNGAHEIGEQTWEYIEDNLLLSKVNQKRLEILKNL